jgi:hypothetical protein
VLIWDEGPYRNISHGDDDQVIPLSAALQEGCAAVWLEGHKLRGGFALVRTKRNEGRDWLLVKMADEGADAGSDPTRTRPASVVSGRTIEEIAEEGA